MPALRIFACRSSPLSPSLARQHDSSPLLRFTPPEGATRAEGATLARLFITSIALASRTFASHDVWFPVRPVPGVVVRLGSREDSRGFRIDFRKGDGAA